MKQVDFAEILSFEIKQYLYLSDIKIALMR